MLPRPLLVQRVETPGDAYGALACGVDLLVGPPSVIEGLPGVSVLRIKVDFCVGDAEPTIVDFAAGVGAVRGVVVMGNPRYVRNALVKLFGHDRKIEVEPVDPENLNEVPPDAPGVDQQSEETPRDASGFPWGSDLTGWTPPPAPPSHCQADFDGRAWSELYRYAPVEETPPGAVTAYPPTLRVETGDRFTYTFGSATDHPEVKEWEVRAVVDGEWVVCRSKRPGPGHHWGEPFLGHATYFELLLKSGDLQRSRK